jgi:hypothetical protein
MLIQLKNYLRFLLEDLRVFFFAVAARLVLILLMAFFAARFGLTDFEILVALAVNFVAVETIIPAVVPTVRAMLVRTSSLGAF